MTNTLLLVGGIAGYLVAIWCVLIVATAVYTGNPFGVLFYGTIGTFAFAGGEELLWQR